jgi:hypothetical protein
MKTALQFTFMILLASLAACSGIDSRIDSNRSAFDTYPPDIQQKIRAGSVDIGFTAEQVRMALGDPDHRYTRQTAEGTLDVWGYRDSGPSFSFGIGGGSFGGSTGLGGGVGVSTGTDYVEDKTRVVFQGDRVTSVEKQVKQ